METTLRKARARHLKTVFLCHSHRDAEFVEGFVTLLAESDWQVYVDWADHTMPDRPSRVTAEKLRLHIAAADYFVFLATPNSMSSRWCPWEIGYADGTKNLNQILVCPTSDGATTHGSEYLDLYRKIDVADSGALAAWLPGERNGAWLSSL